MDRPLAVANEAGSDQVEQTYEQLRCDGLACGIPIGSQAHAAMRLNRANQYEGKNT